MNCKRLVTEAISEQCHAEASLEYDGSGHFTQVVIGSPDAPTVVAVHVNNTPKMIAFLNGADSKEIAFTWTGDYVENETTDPQKDIAGSVELELVAHLAEWSYWGAPNNKIYATFWIETL